jgi:light-harvesting complex I chlorophyll a/b binding protein 1
MMITSLCFVTVAAQRAFYQPGVPVAYQPGLAYPGAMPVVAGEAAPAFPGFVAAPAPAAPSSSGDFLAMAFVVSMCAVIGYSVGRTSAQPRSQSRAANVERSALPLARLPARAARAPAVSMTSIRPGDVGTTRPLGVYDPLGIMTKNPEKYRRWQEMEIKHGRIAMLAFLHVVVTGAGYRWAGYCSYLSFPPLKFEDIPGGTLASWAALPQAGWAQIVALVAILDNSLFAQDPDREPGDVVGDRIPWVRYSDPAVREFKLNAERNNGRAAMMGIIGMMIHEGLTGNPIFPQTYEPGKFPLIPQFPPLSFLFADLP